MGEERKIIRMGADGSIFGHRPKGQESNHQFTQETIKYGSGSIVIWGVWSR